MNSVIKYILMISLISTVTTSNVLAQDLKKAKVKVEYYKNSNNSERLEAILIAKNKRYEPQTNELLQFYSVTDTSRVFLDEILTDDNGKAIFIISNNPDIFIDSLGILTFEVEYAGSDFIKAAQKKIKIKRGSLEISFFQKDSVKSIEVSATEINPEGEVTPIEGVKILFYIKGTFSLLNFGKEKTDENGNTFIGFPDDMPGDTAGALTIIAKIEGHKKFGTIETMGEINWGVPIQSVKEKQRGLGDTDAPLWMVYTLITLLSFVWISYMYVIFLIIKIKLVR